MTGAYHFNTGDSVQGQINHFFDAAQPDAHTLMALDFEDNRASQMTLAQAVQFLQLGDEKLGRPLWLYSGNRIKELIINASAEVNRTAVAVFCNEVKASPRWLSAATWGSPISPRPSSCTSYAKRWRRK